MFESEITLKVEVNTSKKFQHPGGPQQFNPYLENQSTSLTQSIIKKLGDRCKNFTIDYQRDGTGIIKTFTIVLNLITEEGFTISVENHDKISKATIESMKEINPNTLLYSIPYKVDEQLIGKITQVDLEKLELMVKPHIGMDRDYFKNLKKVTYDFAPATAQKQKAVIPEMFAHSSLPQQSLQNPHGQSDSKKADDDFGSSFSGLRGAFNQ